MVRPTMNESMLRAAPHKALPASNSTTEDKYSHLALKIPNSFPL